jgi:hypothetical protein
MMVVNIALLFHDISAIIEEQCIIKFVSCSSKRLMAVFCCIKINRVRFSAFKFGTGVTPTKSNAALISMAANASQQKALLKEQIRFI